ncbi:hypothetical protein WCLP8_4210012 [uncultured Gammaproteobacteria bacterium]
MTDESTPSGRISPQSWVYATCAAFILVVSGLIFYGIIVEREGTLRAARDTTRDLSLAYQADTEQVLGNIDQALRLVVASYPPERAGREGASQIDEALRLISERRLTNRSLGMGGGRRRRLTRKRFWSRGGGA